MNAEEMKASGMILDLGVPIPLRPLRFLDAKRKPRTIIIRQPYSGGLIRMSRQFSEIGVTHEEMKDYTIDQNMAFIAEHGKAAARIVAGSIVRGFFTYPIFGRIVAWWLLWRVHPVFLSEALFQLRENVNINPFKNIIRSAQALNLMKPRLSR
jgi:hypothetical protein